MGAYPAKLPWLGIVANYIFFSCGVYEEIVE